MIGRDRRQCVEHLAVRAIGQFGVTRYEHGAFEQPDRTCRFPARMVGRRGNRDHRRPSSRVEAVASQLAHDRTAPPFVMVTHHVDEIPSGVTHAAMLRDGDLLAAGPIDDVMTADSLSSCFGLPLELERRADGRFGAWART